MVTYILYKFNVFVQVNFLSDILSYNQFWSLVDALVAIIVPLALRNPKIRIEWISTMAANDKPYGIYNRSSFGYMIEILGINVPVFTIFSKARLLYKLRGGKSKDYYTAYRHVLDRLDDAYDHGYHAGVATNNINKIKQHSNIGEYNKAEMEYNEFLTLLKSNVKQNYIKLKPYSVTFKSVYTPDLNRILMSRFKGNKLLNYRLKHGEPCMYYIVFRTPKGKLFIHRSFYCEDVMKYKNGDVSRDIHYDYFNE